MIPERLRELRLSKGMLQRDISTHLRLTRETYSKYERGVTVPPLVVVEKLSLLYDVSADYIIGTIDYPVSLSKNSSMKIINITCKNDVSS